MLLLIKWRDQTSGWLMKATKWALVCRHSCHKRISEEHCKRPLTDAIDVVAARAAAEDPCKAGLVGDGLVVPAGPAAHQRGMVELLCLHVTISTESAVGSANI